MRLRLKAKNEVILVDFICEGIIGTPDLHLLVYQYDTATYIIKDGTAPDILTDNFAEFHLTKLQHIAHGYFMYENKKVGAQIGFYLRPMGVSGLVKVLLSHDFGDVFFYDENCEIFGSGDTRHMIIDLEGFNSIRRLMGLNEFTLKEYISRKLAHPIADDKGITFKDETSLFSVIPDKFDTDNIMTVKGMRVFLEEQDKKKSAPTL